MSTEYFYIQSTVYKNYPPNALKDETIVDLTNVYAFALIFKAAWYGFRKKTGKYQKQPILTLLRKPTRLKIML